MPFLSRKHFIEIYVRTRLQDILVVCKMLTVMLHVIVVVQVDVL